MSGLRKANEITELGAVRMMWRQRRWSGVIFIDCLVLSHGTFAVQDEAELLQRARWRTQEEE